MTYTPAGGLPYGARCILRAGAVSVWATPRLPEPWEMRYLSCLARIRICGTAIIERDGRTAIAIILRAPHTNAAQRRAAYIAALERWSIPR